MKRIYTLLLMAVITISSVQAQYTPEEEAEIAALTSMKNKLEKELSEPVQIGQEKQELLTKREKGQAQADQLASEIAALKNQIKQLEPQLQAKGTARERARAVLERSVSCYGALKGQVANLEKSVKDEASAAALTKKDLGNLQREKKRLSIQLSAAQAAAVQAQIARKEAQDVLERLRNELEAAQAHVREQDQMLAQKEAEVTALLERQRTAQGNADENTARLNALYNEIYQIRMANRSLQETVTQKEAAYRASAESNAALSFELKQTPVGKLEAEIRDTRNQMNEAFNRTMVPLYEKIHKLRDENARLQAELDQLETAHGPVGSGL